MIELETRERVAILTLNRPEKKNSLVPESIREIQRILNSLQNISVIVFRGKGGFFSAGADLSAMEGVSEETASEFSREGNRVMDQVQDFGAITIAALEGGAYGGGLELALSCDLRVASPQTKMGLTEINLGLLPGWGGMKRIARIAGLGAARYVALTGKIMNGTEAHDLGLVNYLSEDPLKFAEELAVEFSRKSGESIKKIKELLGRAEYSSDLESRLFGQIVNSPAAKSAREKFLKK